MNKIPVCEIVVNNKKFYALNEYSLAFIKKYKGKCSIQTSKGKEYKSLCLSVIESFVEEDCVETEYINNGFFKILALSEKALNDFIKKYELPEVEIMNDKYRENTKDNKNPYAINHYIAYSGNSGSNSIFIKPFNKIDDFEFIYTKEGVKSDILFTIEEIKEMLKTHTYEEVYFIQKQKHEKEKQEQLEEYRKIEDPIERQIKTKEVEIFYDCSEEVKSVIRAKNIISPLEQIILIRLFNAPFSIKPQELLLNKYKVDFLIDEDIVIEIDGYKYHKDEKQMLKDYERTRELQLAGYSVFRFLGKEVKKYNGYFVAKDICKIVKHKRDMQKNN